MAESQNHDTSRTPTGTTPAALPNFEVVIDKAVRDREEFERFPNIEGDDDDEVIEPAYYYENMGIPVFTPTMDQFRSFRRFVDKINPYGMKSGIVKIIPPQEWTESLPPLDDKVKEIRIKNPIEQHLAGVSGEYRQTNLEKQRTYNLPQWRQLCEGSDHQPPARRGERRKGQSLTVAKRPIRVKRSNGTLKPVSTSNSTDPADEVPMETDTRQSTPPIKMEMDAWERQPRSNDFIESTPELIQDAYGRQPKKKRVYKSAKVRAAEREIADEEAYDGFDYRFHGGDQYTPERCEELEKAYWRTLTYNSPLYGADMPGSLFDDSTSSWNVARLENLLDCLGKKLPGVNTAYLYLGMWKSTFAWHLEDMDLYSINYIHFGAPKQWYSISRSDKPKFEQLMKGMVAGNYVTSVVSGSHAGPGIFPNDAKKCTEFLRHKTFLISPNVLAHHGIKVNKLVHHQGEFVITFPFGYHSGYNLDYNCAESVNFATTAWLEYGRNAKKCECVGDSVFVDVDEIERKLRGEPTDDEGDLGFSEDGFDEMERDSVTGIGPRSGDGKERSKILDNARRGGTRPRRNKPNSHKVPVKEPCILCPNNLESEQLLPTENGEQAHRLCAIYTPETYFKWDAGEQREVIANIGGIPRARLELKCYFCRGRKGSCFQCSAKKCTRAYHATCAAAAGVLVNMVDVETVEDGQVHRQTNIDYRCRFHRPKRAKDIDTEQLEEDALIRLFATSLIPNDTIQMQFLKGDVFAGVVIENRKDEATVLIRTLPKGELLEIEWKWILAQDPSKIDFPDAIATAPLFADSEYRPSGRSQPARTAPEVEEAFGEGFVWGELLAQAIQPCPDQQPVNLNRNFWYYLGEKSTEYIARYSADPTRRVPDDGANIVPQKKSRARPARPQARPAANVYAPMLMNPPKFPASTYGDQSRPGQAYSPQSIGWSAGYQFHPTPVYEPYTSPANSSSQPSVAPMLASKIDVHESLLDFRQATNSDVHPTQSPQPSLAHRGGYEHRSVVEHLQQEGTCSQPTLHTAPELKSQHILSQGIWNPSSQVGQAYIPPAGRQHQPPMAAIATLNPMESKKENPAPVPMADIKAAIAKLATRAATSADTTIASIPQQAVVPQQ